MSWEIRTGDALEQLREMPERSVHCVVTSPPYFGLRDYGTGQWDGGDPDCTHRVGGQVPYSKAPASIAAGMRPGVDATRCRDCGAGRVDQQIGLERTPEQFVATLVDVFREVRRVLRDDGTVWLNLGDSYASAPPGNKRPGAGASSTLHGVMSERYRQTLDQGKGTKRDTRGGGAKAKDLLMIPAQVALALRADGWHLRSEIVWAKPNPMPESVTDRPTCAHEKLFLLAKSKRYYYDAEAIKEPDGGRPSGNGFEPERLAHRLSGGLSTGNAEQWQPGGGRNKRNVWEIATCPYPEAHFATFPPKLVEPCILAGASPRACEHCGAPWQRLVERQFVPQEDVANSPALYRDPAALDPSSRWGASPRGTTVVRTLGWEPSCDHGEPVSAQRPPPGLGTVVLDPFAGAGTTGLVALRHERSFLGIELSAEFAELARQRIRDDAPLMNTLTEVA